MAKPNVPTSNPAEFVAPPLPPAVEAILAMQPTTPTPQQTPPQPFMPQSSPTFDIRAGQTMTPQGYAYGGRVPHYAMGGPVPQQVGLMPQPGMGGPMPQQAPQSMQQITERIHQSMMRAVQSGKTTPQRINTLMQMAIAAQRNPNLYPQLRAIAIQRNLAPDKGLPPQFRPEVVQAIIDACQMVLKMVGGEGQPSAPPPVAQPPQMAAGGRIPISASPTNSKTGVKDDVPIRVSGGEYVIPKHIVEAKGTEFFDSMLTKYNEGSK